MIHSVKHPVSPINTLRTNELVAVLSFLPNQSFARVARASQSCQEAVQTSLWARSPELREAGWEDIKQKFYCPEAFNILKRLLIANPTETLAKAKENSKRILDLARRALKAQDLNEETKATAVAILDAIAKGDNTDSALKAVETIIEIPSFDLGAAAVVENLLTILNTYSAKEPFKTSALFEKLAKQGLNEKTKAAAVTILNAFANGVNTSFAVRAVELIVKLELSEDTTNFFNQYQHVLLKGAREEKFHLYFALRTIIESPSFDLGAAAVAEKLLTILNAYSAKEPFIIIEFVAKLAKQGLNEKSKAAAVTILNAIVNGVHTSSALQAVELIVSLELSEDTTNFFNQYQHVLLKGVWEENLHLYSALHAIIKSPSFDWGAAAVAENLFAILNTYSAKNPFNTIALVEQFAKQGLNKKTKAMAVAILDAIAKGDNTSSAVQAVEAIVKLNPEDTTNCLDHFKSALLKGAREEKLHLYFALRAIIKSPSFDLDAAGVSENLHTIINAYPLTIFRDRIIRLLESQGI